MDRCRPDFALELLERVKHIFSTPNVHFVLSTHLHQLENSVRFGYGSEIDARTYLQKFYNLIVHFPERGGKHTSERLTTKYLNYLGNLLSLTPDDLDVVGHVAEANDLSFRSVERIVTCVALGKAFTPKNYLWLKPIILSLCVLKILSPELFRRAKAGKLKIADVESVLRFSSWDEDSRKEWVRNWWIYCLGEKEDSPNMNWERFRESLFNYSIDDRKEIVPLMAGYLDRLVLPKG